MTCADCDDLRRQLREAREEIAAWEAGAREDHVAWLTADRLARWRRAFGRGRLAAVVTLMLMVEKPDRLITTQMIIAAGRSVPGATRDRDPGPKIATVNVFYARRYLKAAGLSALIRLSWGQGWFMTAADAKAVSAFVGEGT